MVEILEYVVLEIILNQDAQVKLKNMKYYLYKVRLNWADEINFRGYYTLTEKELEGILEIYKILDPEIPNISVSFGSNQYDDYPLTDLYPSDPKMYTELSESDYNILCRLELTSAGYVPNEFTWIINDWMMSSEGDNSIYKDLKEVLEKYFDFHI